MLRTSACLRFGGKIRFGFERPLQVHWHTIDFNDGLGVMTTASVKLECLFDEPF